jgi:hypothetical protein
LGLHIVAYGSVSCGCFDFVPLGLDLCFAKVKKRHTHSITFCSFQAAAHESPAKIPHNTPIYTDYS